MRKGTNILSPFVVVVVVDTFNVVFIVVVVVDFVGVVVNFYQFLTKLPPPRFILSLTL